MVELTVRELAFAKAHKMWTSWGKAWKLVCLCIIDRQSPFRDVEVLLVELEELLVELEVTHRHLNLEVLLEVLLVELEEEDNFALTSRTTSRSAVVVKE